MGKVFAMQVLKEEFRFPEPMPMSDTLVYLRSQPSWRTQRQVLTTSLTSNLCSCADILSAPMLMIPYGCKKNQTFFFPIRNSGYVGKGVFSNVKSLFGWHAPNLLPSCFYNMSYPPQHFSLPRVWWVLSRQVRNEPLQIKQKKSSPMCRAQD